MHGKTSNAYQNLVRKLKRKKLGKVGLDFWIILKLISVECDVKIFIRLNRSSKVFNGGLS
jgi:hypothetical protein